MVAGTKIERSIRRRVQDERDWTFLAWATLFTCIPICIKHPWTPVHYLSMYTTWTCFSQMWQKQDETHRVLIKIKNMS